MAEFRVNLDKDGEVLPEKRQVILQKTANPFGNQMIIEFEDDAGEIYDKFGFGQRAEVSARELETKFFVKNADDLRILSGETFSLGSAETEQYRRISNRGTVNNAGRLQSIADDPRESFAQLFAGYTVKRDDKKQERGRDLTEITVYSFDQLLRADSVSNDQTGNTITEALEDIIKTDTAVTWNASKVTVEDEQELTESLQGAKVEDALLKLSQKSVSESISVDDSIEFVFEEQETVAAPSDITADNWIDYEIPERGEESKNESRTFYDSGDRVAVVDDGVEQLELQEELNTADPVVISEDRERDDLTDVADASEESEASLQDKDVAKVYKFTSEATDFLSAEPGQTLDVTIDPAGIDGEFVIAAIEFDDRQATAELTCIRNKGNVDDVLRRITERLRRVELSNADFDGPQDRINISELGIVLQNTATVDGTEWDRTRVTNTLRNQLRAGWGGKGNVDVAEIAVGDDSSNLSRTNTDLENEVARTSASETLNGSKGVTYNVSVSQAGIKEIGLFDSSGNLLYRAVNDTAASPGSVDVALTVQNDESFAKAVVTDLGQEAFRDIIADNSPTLPAEFGFGSDQTEPTEADTSLSSLFNADLGEVPIQSASTQSEWESIANPADDVPIGINNGSLELQRIAWIVEAKVSTGSTTSAVSIYSDSDFSGGDGVKFETLDAETTIPGSAQAPLEVDHRIPESNVEIAVRLQAPDVDEFDITVTILDADFNEIGSVTAYDSNSNTTLDWIIDSSVAQRSDDWVSGDIEPGEYRVKCEVTGVTGSASTAETEIDLFGFYDDRYKSNLNFDNSNGGSGGYLDGPELYPDVVELGFETATTRRTVTEATATQSWNDTTGKQFIELSNDGSTFIRGNNTATQTATFASAERGVDTRVGLGRYGGPQSATPRFGYKNQAISSHDLTANPDAVVPDAIGTVLTVAILPRNEITGDTIKELGQLDSNQNTLTRSIRAALDVEQDMRVIARERLQIAQE